MAELPLINNAVGWVHYRMKNGLRNAVAIAAAYFFIVGGLMVLSIRIEPRSSAQTLYGWMVALLFLQMAILVLYGGMSVRNVVRKDYTTGMIASHRLMPVSATEVMVGYLIGAGIQPLVIATANLMLGLLAAGPARLDPGDWLVGNALLVLFAVCSWVVVATVSLASPKSAGALFFGLMLFSIPGAMVLVAVPALTAICSPLVGPTVYGLVMTGATWNPVLHTSTFAQLAVTLMFFIAGTRKLRRDDVLAVGPLFGLVIVGVFVAISAAAITNWPLLQPRMFGMPGGMSEAQTVSSSIFGMLLGLSPVSAAAWLQEDYRRRRLLGDCARVRRQVSFAAVAIVAAGMVTALGALCDPTLTFRPWPLAATILCIASALLSAGCVMRWRYRTHGTTAAFVCVWIILTWVGPWLVSGAILASDGLERASRMTNAWDRSEMVTGFSPIGTLISIWATAGKKVLPGLVFQCLLAAAMLLWSRMRRDHDSQVVVPVSGSA